MAVQLAEQTYRVRITRSASGGISKGTQQFDVALEDRMTVLDALFRIQREQDPGLTFRCACRVGMCGTCAVSINGIPRLACKTRVRTLDPGIIQIAPLPNLPVIKDLAVSLEPFFENWLRVKPAFRPANPESTELACVPESSPYARQTPEKRDCITCGICYAACGVKSTSGEYLGPAAINKAYLRLMDPRDVAVKERMDPLNGERGGVWRCHTQFNCTAVCPKGITLTDSIAQLKRAMLFPGEVSKGMIFRKYRDQFAGQTAQVLQRATGLLLLVYLFLHVHTIHELSAGPAAFNAALATFRHPLFKLLEIALLGTVILHALNGIRITLIDLGVGHRSQRRMFWIYSVGLGVLIFLAGAIPIFISSILKS